MKKAFTVCLPRNDDSGNDGTLTSEAAEDVRGDVDDDSLWEPLDATDQLSIDQTLSKHCRQLQLQCYMHTLQLMVGDGLKEAQSTRPALGKASHISVLMHTSVNLHELFQTKFGTKIGIPAVCARWNLTV